MTITIKTVQTVVSDTEEQELVGVLHDAFKGKPFQDAIIGGHPELLPLIIRAQLRVSLALGTVFVATQSASESINSVSKGKADSEVAGVIACFPPGLQLEATEEIRAAITKMGAVDPELMVWWTGYYVPTTIERTTAIFGAQYQRGGWEISLLGVRNSWQEKGIGKALMEFVISKAKAEKDAGARHVAITTASEKAVRFYKGLGCELKGTYEVKALDRIGQTFESYCVGANFEEGEVGHKRGTLDRRG